jgi:hypothetical protein
MRMNRWAKAGVLDRLFAELQREQLIRKRSGNRVLAFNGSRCD